MRKSYDEIKNSEMYREILASLKTELSKNSSLPEPVDCAIIVREYRAMLYECIEMEGWTLDEFYRRGDNSVDYGWTATGPHPNFHGMNDLAKEFGEYFS